MRLKAIIQSPIVFIIFILYAIRIFVISPETLAEREEAQLLPIIVPYSFAYSAYLLPLTIVLIFLCFVWYVRRIKFSVDAMSKFLWIRLALFPLQFAVCMHYNVDIRYGNYMLYVIELLFYLSCYASFSLQTCNSFINMIRALTLVVSIETIIQGAGLVVAVDYLSTWYKANMVIPIGGTNTISAIILPCLIAEFYSNTKYDKWNLILIFAGVVAMILTKSRWGIVLMILFFVYYARKNNQGAFLKFCYFLISIAFLYFIYKSAADIYTFLIGFSDVSEGGVTSGRTTMWKEYLYDIIRSPLFGNGPNYVESRAHNIVVDILYQTGIIGIALFIVAFKKLYNKCKHHANANTHEVKYFSSIAFVMLVQSLGEITFFTDIVCNLIFLPSVAYLSILTESNKNNYNTIQS